MAAERFGICVDCHSIDKDNYCRGEKSKFKGKKAPGGGCIHGKFPALEAFDDEIDDLIEKTFVEGEVEMGDLIQIKERGKKK